MSRHLTRRQRRAGKRKRRNFARDWFLELPQEEQDRRNARDRDGATQLLWDPLELLKSPWFSENRPTPQK